MSPNFCEYHCLCCGNVIEQDSHRLPPFCCGVEMTKSSERIVPHEQLQVPWSVAERWQKSTETRPSQTPSRRSPNSSRSRLSEGRAVS